MQGQRGPTRQRHQGVRTRKLVLLALKHLQKGMVANGSEMLDQLGRSARQQACFRHDVSSGEANCCSPGATHQQPRAIDQPRALLREERRPSTPARGSGSERMLCGAQQAWRRTRVLTYGSECSSSRTAGSPSSAGRAEPGRAPSDAPAESLVGWLSVDECRENTPASMRPWSPRHSQTADARRTPAHAPVRGKPAALVARASCTPPKLWAGCRAAACHSVHLARPAE